MHFNFHLSGDETPEQSRRIANAVLALGGVTHSVGEITVDLKLDTSQAVEAIRDLASHPDVIASEATFLHKSQFPESSQEDRRFVPWFPDLDVPTGRDLVARLRDTPNWKKESFGDFKTMTSTYDRSPKEAADYIESFLTSFADCLNPLPDTTSMEPNISGLKDSIADALNAAGVAHVEPPLPDVPTVTPPLPPIVAESPAPVLTTDKNGLPWDERIHSSSRAINADGTWRYRKNVPDETKHAVEAELRGAIAVGQTVEIPEVPSLNADLSNIVTYAGAKAIPVPPIPAVAPPVPVSTVQRSYSDVVNLIMANQATLNKPELYVAVLGMSLPEFAAACIAKPELAAVAFNALDEIRRS